jgi:hypothetical protein
MKHAHEYDKMTDESLMEKVKKGWRSNETPCGSGSELKNAQYIIKLLPVLIKEHNITTISDVGAGDLNWIKHIELKCDYKGYDLYPRHKNVIQFDATKEVVPQSDLILCRHVLNHLSIQYSEFILSNFIKSKSKYLLMTNFEKQKDYWKQYNLKMETYGYKKIKTYEECDKWELELYESNNTID